MAVTLTWIEWITGETPGTTPHDTFSFKTGGDTPPTITSASNINFGNVSSRDITAASNPVTAGSNSFTKYFRVNFSGSYTSISNAKLWKSAGAYVTGESIQFSGNIAYAAPTETDASDGAVATATPTNNVGLNAYDPADTAAQDKTLPNGSESASSPGYYSGSRTSTMRFQMITTGSSPAGAVNQKTISLSYDRT